MQHLRQLCQLPSLVSLCLSHTPSRPEDVVESEALAVRLEYLECLELSGPHLFGLDIHRCPRLHTLSLEDCWLGNRVSLRGCTQLRALIFTLTDLSHAADTWLNEELWRVPCLQELWLDQCMLLEVPALGCMTALTQLRIEGNGIRELEWLPPSLQYLNVTSCYLREVPAALESLPNLVRLEVSGQEVEVQVLRPLLPLVSSCANLKKLAIGGTRCWSMASLAHITQLLQHLEAEGRDQEFCFTLDGDKMLAVVE
jgi:hypothetical protein